MEPSVRSTVNCYDKFQRTGCAACTGIVLLVAASACSAAPAQPPRPNILFIYTDDQSHRTVGCYGEAYDWVRTPNIDRLAGHGVRFTHAYIGTWCMPSRATLLTGHHPYGVESMRMQGKYVPIKSSRPAVTVKLQ